MFKRLKPSTNTLHQTKKIIDYRAYYKLIKTKEMRYILNISFHKNSLNIVEPFKTLKEAESYKSIIDDTVKQALIKDTVNGNVIWLKK